MTWPPPPIRRIDPWDYPATVRVYPWLCMVCGEEGHESSLTRQDKASSEHSCPGSPGPTVPAD